MSFIRMRFVESVIKVRKVQTYFCQSLLFKQVNYSYEADHNDTKSHYAYEGETKSFRTGRLERELQMVTALCHEVQLYRYFVSQSSEFCRHSPLCCLSTIVYFCYLFCYQLRWKILDTPL